MFEKKFKRNYFAINKKILEEYINYNNIENHDIEATLFLMKDKFGYCNEMFIKKEIYNNIYMCSLDDKKADEDKHGLYLIMQRGNMIIIFDNKGKFYNFEVHNGMVSGGTYDFINEYFGLKIFK